MIEACRSVQYVVRGFLETSARKLHHYISRYPEILEKKVTAYSPENTVQSNVYGPITIRVNDLGLSVSLAESVKRSKHNY